MTIFNLPEDIALINQTPTDDLIFHRYHSHSNVYNGRSILNKNAVSLVINGEKTMHFAEKTVNIKDDEFHFLSTGNCLVSMKLSPEILFSSILIFFDDQIINSFYQKYQEKIDLIKKNKIVKEPFLVFKKDGFIINFINSLNSLFESGVSLSLDMKKLKFEELMLYIFETHPEKLLSFQLGKVNEFNDQKIKKTVESNIVNNISLEEMAFLCNVSLSTFKRRFIKIYNLSPSKWLLKKRMEMARDLLIYEKEKPSKIYYQLGYENHSSFSQSFKQIFGQSPKEYQQKQLNS